MAVTMHGIDVEQASLDDGDEYFQLWQYFLTDNLHKFIDPNIIDDPYGGDIEYCFQHAVEVLIKENIMISEDWLDALEVAAYVSPMYADKFAEYAKGVRAHHAKATA